jgi:hypothetical protein
VNAITASLGGDQRLDIFAAGYPKVQAVACDTGAPVDGIEEALNAGQSTLIYEQATDRYVYIWKTVKGWGGTCRQLQIGLNDGETYTANFVLKSKLSVWTAKHANEIRVVSLACSSA